MTLDSVRKNKLIYVHSKALEKVKYVHLYLTAREERLIMRFVNRRTD